MQLLVTEDLALLRTTQPQDRRSTARASQTPVVARAIRPVAGHTCAPARAASALSIGASPYDVLYEANSARRGSSSLATVPAWKRTVSGFEGRAGEYRSGRRRSVRRLRHVSKAASPGSDSSAESEEPSEQPKKHPVIERVEVYRVRDDVPQETMQEMMDNLYTMQYSFSGILCCSVGEVLEGPFTHAMHLRFPSMDMLDKFLLHPVHHTIQEKYVKPNVEDSLVMNFEGKVEDDVFAVFRRGDMWAEGVEHITLYSMKDDESEAADEAVGELASLPTSLDSKAVLQVTGGRILSGFSQGFTHGVLARIPGSVDSGALQIYNMDPDRQTVLSESIAPLQEDAINIDYEITAVDQKSGGPPVM